MKIPLFLLVAQLSISAKAQDTLKYSTQTTIPYPAFKRLTIQQDYFGNSDYKISNKGGELQEQGEVSGSRFKINGAIPIYKKNRFSLIAGVLYTRQSINHYKKVDDMNNQYQKTETKYSDFDALLSATYIGKLWNKVLITNGTVIIGSTNFFGIKKINGLVTSTLVIKASASTISTLGLSLVLDKSSLVPVIPVYSYWHKFSGSDWEIDAILPQKLIFRRSGVLNGWLSAGAELRNDSFFLKLDGDGVNRSGNYEWISNEIFSNIGYEYLLGKNFLLGIKGGFRNTLTTRLIRVNDKYDDYRAKTKIASTFFNMSLSFVLPSPGSRR
ncbi:hypothetical protein N180_09245 [Pedobacter antarcticus 4BY]|uniref:Outer membrane protein beta-barrel domain-containing protein n=2 Tax=Pedobacter antarcticus TaxID=34086 RepID=A0A081PIF3_9SPHI|nr:hypothetical protein [Pedobacter antarcticus]KEQ30476.1 hypothetical protein N180_09245 [Pedobacter antarcticus 4BY]SFF37853.1 hypothetical protein SAMN03003324_03579 [Pedobacter antarcticus]